MSESETPIVQPGEQPEKQRTENNELSGQNLEKRVTALRRMCQEALAISGEPRDRWSTFARILMALRINADARRLLDDLGIDTHNDLMNFVMGTTDLPPSAAERLAVNRDLRALSLSAEQVGALPIEVLLLAARNTAVFRHPDELFSRPAVIQRLITESPQAAEEIFMFIVQTQRFGFRIFERYAMFRNAPFRMSLLRAAASQLQHPEDAIRYFRTPAYFPAGSITMEEQQSILASLRKSRPSDAAVFSDQLVFWAPDIQARALGAQVRRDIFRDPALGRWNDVREEWIPWARIGIPARDPKPRLLQPLSAAEERTEGLRSQWRAMIARNLFAQKLPVREDTVRDECLRILREREANRDVPIFAGRNVLLLANNERLTETRQGDAFRFGRNHVQHAIQVQQQGGGRLSFLRSEPSAADDRMQAYQRLLRSKDDALDRICKTAPPFTFVFSGHGMPDGLYLNQGEFVQGSLQSTGVRITPDELAEAWIQRARLYPQLAQATPQTRDLIILDSCFSTDFLRAFYSRLGSAPRPTVIGTTEYNQVGFTRPLDRYSPYGSSFFANVLNLEQQPHSRSTLGTVFQNLLEGDTKPVVIIPDTQQRPIHISHERGLSPDDRESA